MKGERTILELALKCNHLRVLNGASNDDNAQRNAVMMEKFQNFWDEHAHNPLRGRNIIISSFCPQVCFDMLFRILDFMKLVLVFARGIVLQCSLYNTCYIRVEETRLDAVAIVILPLLQCIRLHINSLAFLHISIS